MKHVGTCHGTDKQDHYETNKPVKIEAEDIGALQKGSRSAGDLKESVSLVSYSCVQCRSKFKSIEDLNDHVETEHEKILCSQCVVITISKRRGEWRLLYPCGDN